VDALEGATVLLLKEPLFMCIFLRTPGPLLKEHYGSVAFNDCPCKMYRIWGRGYKSGR
jgi:hypothetical protein